MINEHHDGRSNRTEAGQAIAEATFVETPPWRTDTAAPSRERRLIPGLRRRITLIGLVAVALGGVATLAVGLLPPHYVAESLVTIESRKGQLFQFSNVVSSLPPDLAVMKSESEGLQSYAMARKVAERLDPEERRMLIDGGILNSMRRRAADRIGAFRQALPAALATRLSGPLDGLVAMLTPQPTPDSATAEDEDAIVDRAAKLLRDRVRVEVDGRSYVFHIRFASAVPQLSAEIANTYGAVYIQDQLEVKRGLIKGANSRIASELDQLERKARDSDMAVQRYMVDHGLVQVGGETVVARQLGDVTGEISQVVAERMNREAALDELKHAIEEQPNAAGAKAEVLNSPLIARLREREAELTLRIADLRQRHLPNHPDIGAAEAALRDLRGRIAGEIDRITQSLQAEVDAAVRREASLRERFGTLQASLGTAEEAAVGLRELQRRAGADHSLYESFLRRAGETLAEQGVETPDARLMSEAAIPDREALPPRPLMLVGGWLVAAGFAVSLALFLDRRRRGVQTETEAESRLGVPVLGVSLAARRRAKPVDMVVRDRFSPYAEALTQIRTGVQQPYRGPVPRVVMVTSALPGEGKSVFAASFARGAACSGVRTLLIECDLRRPTLAKLLSIPRPWPVAGLLSLGDASQPLPDLVWTDALSGLDVIVAGDGDAHPGDLLRGYAFERLIREAGRAYDLVVLDTPPVLNVSDARIVAPLADHTILAMRWDSTRPETTQSALRSLRSVTDCPVGIVLTRVDSRKQALYQPQSAGYGLAAGARFHQP